ncbi:DUF2267 domain-containing protein [Nocardiopsis sp. NRRL B-16309]|uniref:DUF2267 domain-containing protein n=1 Tax=Nocardiopsis sp. NRRL B-16309 TaxID=1519494 RepID=UPI0006AEDB06|nr:DUF2267 domain-containing protein [Nocardiopsis sp. NRRL B-16309]KOX07851.1 hypothetical protein ADL05_28010 [Nocardiopsis sp. NRRL B-16309]
MIAYQSLVDHVGAHEGVGDAEEARRAIGAVVSVVAPRVAPDTRERLHAALPPALQGPAEQEGAAETGLTDSGDVARRVARELGRRPERGLYLAGVVLSEIAESSPDLREGLAASLPEELAAWVTDPVGAAGRSDTGESDAPSRLDEETLRAALGRLPDWEGDTHGLTRTVRLPSDRVRPLVDAVERIGRDMNHGAYHEVTDDGVAFTVRTASIRAVTTRDIELAERIEQAVAEVGSGGRPGP